MRRPDRKRFDVPTLMILGLPLLGILLITAWQMHRVDDGAKLCDAVTAKDIGLVKRLLDRGADIDTQDNRQRALFRMMSGIQPLPTGGRSQMNWNETPLMIAARQQDEAMVHLLLDRGAHIDQKRSVSQPVLCYVLGPNAAAVNKSFSNIKIARMLLEHGADPNVSDWSGYTLLSLSTQSGRIDEVDLLLAHHANVNLRNSDGSTSLHVAAFQGGDKIAEALLKHGADPNAKNGKGETPLHSTALWAHGPASAAIVRLLLAHGANRDLKDNIGMTPLQCARNAKHTALMALLQKAVAAK